MGNDKKTPVSGHPTGAREMILVPGLSPAEVDVHRFTFYNGIFQWSKQWHNPKKRDAQRDLPAYHYRERQTVPHINLDTAHKIATLKQCIEGTVNAYKTAVDAFKNHKDSAIATGEKVIHQSLGHGVAATETAVSVADFGCQLGRFRQHEFQISTRTFEIYKRIAAAKDFNVVIPEADGRPISAKAKAQALLCFDGLCAIRGVTAGQVNRIRLVTCRVGSDTLFLDHLAWTLGRPRSGEQPTTRIVVEAYQRVVEASKTPLEALFKIGLVDGERTLFGPHAETELPDKFLSRVDPTNIVEPNPEDPLPEPRNPALDLGNCPSMAHLIPKAVLEQ